ncbi:dihydrodipicolinate synthase family protein [Shivajiella indica]|uniref:Dihydrodipicolinate synthase family protein n=1 Tax=Shivajiella indica TaxID=872115 RepID=A0ABW5B3Z8_9BACT
MDQKETDNNYKGIIVPMVTPLHSNGELDKKGTERLIRHLIHGGVHGIFILGTTGEASSLKPALTKEMIELSCKEAKGEVKILVGISHTCLDVSVKLAQIAKENGADAVVALTPYYFYLDQEELEHYYVKLADESPLPVFIYNFPRMTKLNLEPETAEKLSRHPNIIGIKDSSGNGVYLQKLLQIKKKRQDFSIFVGPEEMLAQSILTGADGGISGGANIFPELYVSMFEASKNKDWGQIEKFQEIIMEISQKIYAASPKNSAYFSGVKESLYHLGICEPHLASPMIGIDDKSKEYIYQHLDTIHSKIKKLKF